MEIRFIRRGIMLVMAVYDTEENGRTAYTEKTLSCLLKTVNFKRHTLFISDNASCKATQDLYLVFKEQFTTLFPEKNLIICLNDTNLGTAKGVNKGIQVRGAGQKVLKLDNDLGISREGWLDEMEEAMDGDFTIGILGLKRVELEQHPDHTNPAYKTTLRMLPHYRGKKWIVVEYAEEIIGTCILLNSQLLDRVGGLEQIDIYGWDDSNISLRSKIAGYRNAFLPHIPIVHLDRESGVYTDWKREHAGETIALWQEMKDDYEIGVRDIYVDPFD